MLGPNRVQNLTIRMAVYERQQGEEFWRLRSTYESGSEQADTAVYSLEEVWEHAASQGISRKEVVFKDQSFEQLSRQP